MEQNLILEIVDALLKEDLHTRALAKKLGINHMTVARKLRSLEAENILDYTLTGKNRVYHLKKNPEARNYAIMAEHYKLNKSLGKHPKLRRIIECVQENPAIGLAVLYGSYAKDAAGKDSDIDVYIETGDRKIKKDLELLNTKLSIKIGAYDRTSPLIRELEKNHVIIKGAERYYEKNRFFS